MIDIFDQIFHRNITKIFNLTFSETDTKISLTKNLENILSYFDLHAGTRMGWIDEFDVPLSPILTKHGLCYTFNILPDNELLYLSRVSEDFQYDVVFYGSKYTDFNSDFTKELEMDHPWFTRSANKGLFLQLFTISKMNADPELYPLSGDKVFVHSPYELPINGKQTSFHRLQHTTVYLAPKLTMLDDNLNNLPLEE